MNLLIDERSQSDYAFYIDGNLQFDTADEALYHESMALPALGLAQAQADRSVLICGGGDGLVLRECLRFPGVKQVDLVDYSDEVVQLGRTRFAETNGHAFDDPRVRVQIADAWERVQARAGYDAILCDFTFPRTAEDARVFSLEWYEKLASALAPGGVIAINAVSPQATPEAFCCLTRTVRAAGLHAFPYRVCIPSFRQHGYGVWGFLLAAHRPLHKSDFSALDLAFETRQADVSRLWRGTRFSRHERRLMAGGPVNSLADPCLLKLLATARGTADLASVQPPDFEALLDTIPITHPYHTRSMIETLAEQVVGTLSSIDIRRLIDELLKRAATLSARCVEELKVLRDYIASRVFHPDDWGVWSSRIFATLVIVLVLSNSLAPDNAYAKGAHGLGHSSMSRGEGVGARAAGPGEAAPAVSAPSAGTITGHGFGGGGSFGSSGPVDIYGTSYRVHHYSYYDYDPYYHGYGGYGYGWGGYGWGYHHYYGDDYYYHNYNGRSRPAKEVPSRRKPVEHKPMFVADDDLMVLDNGDLIVTLSEDAYLLVSQGSVVLINQKSPDPLLPLYADPQLYKTISAQIEDQRGTAKVEVEARRDWLSWTGWTSPMFPVIRQDKQELSNLLELQKRLVAAVGRMGKPSSNVVPASILPSGSVQLFVGGHLLPDGTVAFILPDGKLAVTNGKTMTMPGKSPEKVSPVLTDTIVSIMQKLSKELEADLKASDNDLATLATERRSIQSDLAEYKSIQSQNFYDPSYEVDYGTESIPVGEAVSRTEQDLRDNENETKQAQTERDKDASDASRIAAATQSFGK